MTAVENTTVLLQYCFVFALKPSTQQRLENTVQPGPAHLTDTRARVLTHARTHAFTLACSLAPIATLNQIELKSLATRLTLVTVKNGVTEQQTQTQTHAHTQPVSSSSHTDCDFPPLPPPQNKPTARLHLPSPPAAPSMLPRQQQQQHKLNQHFRLCYTGVSGTDTQTQTQNGR